MDPSLLQEPNMLLTTKLSPWPPLPSPSFIVPAGGSVCSPRFFCTNKRHCLHSPSFLSVGNPSYWKLSNFFPLFGHSEATCPCVGTVSIEGHRGLLAVLGDTSITVNNPVVLPRPDLSVRAFSLSPRFPLTPLSTFPVVSCIRLGTVQKGIKDVRKN